MSNQPVKIVSFSAGNFKRLTAIEIEPSGDVVTLAGDNGAGKSSILDGIEATVAGKDALPEKPIRDGAVKADTTVKLSNGLTLRRVYTASGSTLKITDSDDTPQPSPQGLMDKMIGNLAFDPLDFSRLKGPEQRAILQKLVGLDFTALEAEKKKHYDERTEFNRAIVRLNGQLGAFPAAVGEIPAEETPAASVLAELEAAEENNRHRGDVATRVTTRQGLHTEVVNAINEASNQIIAWQKILKAGQVDVLEKHAAWQEAVAELGKIQEVAVAPIKLKLSQLEGQNQLVRQEKERRRLNLALSIAKHDAERRDAFIAVLDKKKTIELAAAKFPLPGLSFCEDGIFFQGQPWSQISSGEQLRISVAVGMALNPTLRVIFIRNGSLLDKKGLTLIAEMAAANNYQVWMEDARSVDPAAIVIEDGHVKL